MARYKQTSRPSRGEVTVRPSARPVSPANEATQGQGMEAIEQRLTALDAKATAMETTINELKGLQSVVLTQQANIANLTATVHEIRQQGYHHQGTSASYVTAEEGKTELARVHALLATQDAAIVELQSLKFSIKAYQNVFKELARKDCKEQLVRLNNTVEDEEDSIIKVEDTEDLEMPDGMIPGHEGDIDSLRDFWTGKIQELKELQDSYLAGNEATEQRFASLETKAQETDRLLRKLQMGVSKLKQKWRRVGKALGGR